MLADKNRLGRGDGASTLAGASRNDTARGWDVRPCLCAAANAGARPRLCIVGRWCWAVARRFYIGVTTLLGVANKMARRGIGYRAAQLMGSARKALLAPFTRYSSSGRACMAPWRGHAWRGHAARSAKSGGGSRVCSRSVPFWVIMHSRHGRNGREGRGVAITISSSRLVGAIEEDVGIVSTATTAIIAASAIIATAVTTASVPAAAATGWRARHAVNVPQIVVTR